MSVLTVVIAIAECLLISAACVGLETLWVRHRERQEQAEDDWWDDDDHNNWAT